MSHLAEKCEHLRLLHPRDWLNLCVISTDVKEYTSTSSTVSSFIEKELHKQTFCYFQSSVKCYIFQACHKNLIVSRASNYCKNNSSECVVSFDFALLPTTPSFLLEKYER